MCGFFFSDCAERQVLSMIRRFVPIANTRQRVGGRAGWLSDSASALASEYTLSNSQIALSVRERDGAPHPLPPRSMCVSLGYVACQSAVAKLSHSDHRECERSLRLYYLHARGCSLSEGVLLYFKTLLSILVAPNDSPHKRLLIFWIGR